MSASQRRKPRILLVDADPAIRRMLAAVLKPIDSVISQTDSGALALDAVRRNKTDLLLVHNLGFPT